MPRRQCSYCHQGMADDEFKCKSCGNLVSTKTTVPEQPYMTEYEESVMGRYFIVLLVLITILLPPVSITIGGVMLFNDNSIKRGNGQLLVSAGLVVLIMYTIIFFVI